MHQILSCFTHEFVLHTYTPLFIPSNFRNSLNTPAMRVFHLMLSISVPIRIANSSLRCGSYQTIWGHIGGHSGQKETNCKNGKCNNSRRVSAYKYSTDISYRGTLQTLKRRIPELKPKRESLQLAQSGTQPRFNNKPDRKGMWCYLCWNIGHSVEIVLSSSNVKSR